MKKEILFLLVASMTLAQLSAQICQGNLGENIFTEGDFGTGTTNILLPDPQIAPGYNYQPSPPPNDGYYSIANNTSSWGAFAGALWINIGDNSNDADGYMMVINASYDPGLFYEQEVAGLCENTLYVFSADVINVFQAGLAAIKPNISFLLDGQLIYSTGDVAQDEQWHTYGFTFTTDPGQTSLTLSLQNNAPGGYGNDLAIDNISFRPCGPEALILPLEVANICEDGTPIEVLATIIGDQYDNPSVQWQESFDEGQSWQNIPGATSLTFTFDHLIGGSYYYRYLLANGPANLDNPFCRVVSNVKEVKIIPTFYNIVDTLCQGLFYRQNGQQYSETGIYTDSLQNYLGCDSIVTLDLTIVPDPFSIDLGEDQQLNLGESLQLIPFFSAPANSFVWSPSEIINCTEDCERVAFTPTQSSFYTLTAADEHGCYATDSLYVDIVSIREVYIPNIFSPNSDGINDHFAIYANTPNVQVIERLQLFDRWGNLVFEQKNILPNLSSEGWNGETGSKNAPDGVYVYVAKIRFLDDAVIVYTGDVTLVR
jgi:gliding motility-associated-like protein